MAATPWPRDEWRAAIWDCEALTPSERVVAYAYAEYAGNGDVSWCAWEELRRRTGIRSRDALSRAIRGLETGGWLVLVEKARQHRSARYRLAIPSSSSSPGNGPLEEGNRPSSSPDNGPLDGQQSVSRHAAVRFPAPSSPFPGPDLSQITHTDQSPAREPSERAVATADALHKRTGKTVDHDHAERVARQILDAATHTVHAPIRYVESVIERDADPGRFLPTPTPPRHIREEAARATT